MLFSKNANQVNNIQRSSNIIIWASSENYADAYLKLAEIKMKCYFKFLLENQNTHKVLRLWIKKKTYIDRYKLYIHLYY